jgi:hypothetical protein
MYKAGRPSLHTPSHQVVTVSPGVTHGLVPLLPQPSACFSSVFVLRVTVTLQLPTQVTLLDDGVDGRRVGVRGLLADVKPTSVGTKGRVGVRFLRGRRGWLRLLLLLHRKRRQRESSLAAEQYKRARTQQGSSRATEQCKRARMQQGSSLATERCKSARMQQCANATGIITCSGAVQGCMSECELGHGVRG